MSTALAIGPWCHACRHDLLQSFAAISGVRIPRPNSSNLVSRSLTTAVTGGLRTQPPGHGTTEEKTVSDQATGDARRQSRAIPWYLQAENQAQTPHALGQRPELPPLPVNSPMILQSLLQHLSFDIGLDNLALLDLRYRDPPPALGGNLLMIVGSARSTKHLNVSADRFCRWLRSTYKLRPYADGLLGRNELKLKLRRKARRAKIASDAGASIELKDDGITTGWICVNVGIVAAPESEIQKKTREEAFEGFGESAGGTRIVVQMFTEEKRAEVDIETLWGTGSVEQTRDHDSNSASKDEIGDVNFPLEAHRTIHFARPMQPAPTASVGFDFTQRRSFTTTSFSRLGVNPAILGLPTSNVYSDSFEHLQQPWSELFMFLTELPLEKVREELGSSAADKSSTLLLQFINRQLSKAQPSESSAAHIKLMCIGITAGHPSYSPRVLYDMFEEHVSNGYVLSDELGFDIVAALLSPEKPDGLDAVDEPGKSFSNSNKELALEVIGYLSLRGTNVLNTKLSNLLYKLAILATASTNEVEDDQIDYHHYHPPMKSRIVELSTIIDSLGISSNDIRGHMQLRFRNGDYQGFWRLWRSFPFNNITRKSEDYALLFQLHAELGDPVRARECLLAVVPLMDREKPLIPLEGEVAEHVLACVLLADDTVSERKHHGPPTTLGKIWERCRHALQPTAS